MEARLSVDEQKQCLWPYSSDEPNQDALISNLAVAKVNGRKPKHNTPSLLNDISIYENIIREGYRQYQQSSELLVNLSPAAEWMLDNFIIVEQSIRHFRDNLPPSYEKQLPRFAEEPYTGFIRILVLSLVILKDTCCMIDEEQIKNIILQFLDQQSLTTGELWALPSMLRYSLIAALAYAIEQSPELSINDKLQTSVAPFFSHIAIAPEEIISRIIPGLRLLSAIDWQIFFEDCSPIEKIFSRDPAGAYTKMDFESRDLYRKSLEYFASLSILSETEIAEKIIANCLKNEIELEQNKSLTPLEYGLLKRKTHLGYYLVDDGKYDLPKDASFQIREKFNLRSWALQHPAYFYFGVLYSILFLLLAGFLRIGLSYTSLPGSIVITLLSLLPFHSISVGITNYLISKYIPPRRLPKMDYHKGIPRSAQTAVVIPSMLGSKKEIKHILQQLEKHYLSNSSPNLFFILLTDFTDADEETKHEDKQLLEAAISGIEGLNNKHKPVFFLFHRKRFWNDCESCWMGWERKRGKLTQLNHYLLTMKGEAFQTIIGEQQYLENTKYIITLDSDTDLPFQTANSLIATLSHPLNQAIYDADNQKVVKGYAILQPRVQISPAFSKPTFFSKIFVEDTYFDLYTRAVSDTYMDLFGEGIFIGKGIYDISAFARTMENRVKENTLLSHDLFEGIFSRVALASDIVVYEDFPNNLFSYQNRQHRWIRGDWQLTPWLLLVIPNHWTGNIVNGLNFMGRWKITDNLRRSLLSPSILLLLFTSWFFLPQFNLLSFSIMILTYYLPVIIQILTQDIKSILSNNTSNSIARSSLGIVFLIMESAVNLDAILSVLYRVYISRKRLLQWVTAAHAIRLSKKEPKHSLVWRRMSKANLVLAGLLLILIFVQPKSLWIAAPISLLWLFVPKISMLISNPILETELELPPRAEQIFRNTAMRTWMFFETFVGPDDSWLPPDHYQDSPKGVVAHRTSPTNIGLYLLSVASAYELGYLSGIDMTYRIQQTMKTISRMDMYRGHLYNWYDTQTLQPLPPRYISTVDSGNLAACYLTVSQLLLSFKDDPILKWQQFEGLLDCFSVIQEIISEIPDSNEKETALFQISKICNAIQDWKPNPSQWIFNIRSFVENNWNRLEETLIELVEQNATRINRETINAIRVWVGRTRFQADNIIADYLYLAPWIIETYKLLQEIRTKDSREEGLALFCQILEETLLIPTQISHSELSNSLLQKQRYVKANLYFRASAPMRMLINRWVANLDQHIETTKNQADQQNHLIQTLTRRLKNYYQNTQFAFLYHKERQVFHIGYNVETGQLDRNYYDLLASEARIASFLAIAKGDVPQTHWKHLARPITRIETSWTLLSWSATMFEYLMPTAIMKTPRQSILGVSVETAIERQINYAKQHDIPWGISESGYYHFDAQMNYQYRAFGTPGLGLKRGLSNDLVIAPYASLMCALQAPAKVLLNMEKLNEHHARGVYGYYEALDFTPERSPEKEGRIVKSYMSHHQGMVLTAFCNHLKSKRLIHAFHSDPGISSLEILLYETIGRDMPVDYPHIMESALHMPHRKRIVYDPWFPPAQTDPPILHLLSNGKYHVLISNDGAGYSKFESREISRWRNDRSLNQYGTWCYLYEPEKETLWSISEMPVPGPFQYQQIAFHPHCVEFTKSANEMAASMTIMVLSDDNVEIRTISITNQADIDRTIVIGSYSEIILSEQLTDMRHMAFNKLFIENEINHENNTIYFSRRLRSGDEKPFHFGHAWCSDSGFINDTKYCTDREQFLGRAGSIHDPWIYHSKAQYENTSEQTNSLDPIASINLTCKIPAHETITVHFISCAAIDKGAIHQTIQKYNSPTFIQRNVDAEKIKAERSLQQLDIKPNEIELFDKLFSLILYSNDKMRIDIDRIQTNILGQSGLWPYGISGDYPICVIKIKELEEINNLATILKGYIFWRSRHIEIDIVLLNERDTTYDQELNILLQRLLTKLGATPWINRKGGIYILRADQIPLESRILLETSANVVLRPDEDTFDAIRNEKFKALEYLPDFHSILPPIDVALAVDTKESLSELQYSNSIGGFANDGATYRMIIDKHHLPPAPWINVISNPNFGFTISESGIGYSWCDNSGENRLTSWSNDPLLDQPGEALYLRDEETGQFWSPAFLPVPDDMPYQVTHGAGYSCFSHISHGIKTELTYFTDKTDPIKCARLTIKNLRDRTSRISSIYYADWVLGTIKHQNQRFIQQSFDTHLHAIMAKNTFNPDFAGKVAFLAATRTPQNISTNRAEFIGRNGTFSHPIALCQVALSGEISSAHDACAVMSHIFWLSPGEEKEITYLVGQGKNEDDAKQLVIKYQNFEQTNNALSRAVRFWTNTLNAVQIKTPEPSFDILINQWLLYQSISSRFMGRSAFYQSSGAFGFRDQLQDSIAYLISQPDWTREFILEAAKHQFNEGDVLHWWHPPMSRGVRTRCSDDLLWLPYVVAEYINQTGDESILDERIPFLNAPELSENEHDRYDRFPQSTEYGSVLDHCLRAIHRSNTAGMHGIPLIGSHDWNDGFSRIGFEGKGESVWLGWFYCVVLDRFAKICANHQKPTISEELLSIRTNLIEHMLQETWDGKWFIRAYFDDGTPLGSIKNNECQIDAIAQSWSVFAGLKDHPKVQLAMQSVKERLIKEKDQLILLFTPPLDQSLQDPGYIKGYQPGIRENGGQYTHAATWTIWAFAEMGYGDDAFKYFQMINPIHHSETPEKMQRYRVEPYVVAADVYNAPKHVGRGGWTWYTGSASWMYRLGLERIIGLKIQKEGFSFDPMIPKDWEFYEIQLRLPNGNYDITIRNPMKANSGVSNILLDEKPLRGHIIPWLKDNNIHHVIIRLGN
jgi:cyclic beta-1,2-glucan synthetase